MKNTPFFTVIIPTYNRAEFLGEAIKSVLSQTFQDFELIIVDDRSTESMQKVVDLYKDDRIAFMINSRSKGPAGARNSGMLEAKGKWIAFLDDDDVWLPQKLDLLYRKIRKADSETGLIYTGHSSFDFNKKQIITTYVPEKKGWIQQDLLYSNYIGTTSVVSIRSDIVRNVGYMDEEMFLFEDGEYYVRIAGLYKVDFVKEPLTYYRKFNNDKLSDNTINALNAYLLFNKKHHTLIVRRPRIRHRISSLIFICAFKLKRWGIVYEVLPWTAAGILYDFRNLLKTIWAII